MHVYLIIRYISFFSLVTKVIGLKLPFKINGPKHYDDKIAIVGAGPSGIHMALLLKQKGFTNVEILEKENRIGGKSLTIDYRGSIHEMGTVYLAPDYSETVIPLIEKYIPNDLVYLPPASIWLDHLNNSIDYEQYLALFAMKFFNTTVYRVALGGMNQSINKYVKIHEQLFGQYDGEIMEEPKPSVMNQIGGTFLDFLIRNNLEALAPLLYATNAVQGYGRLDEIACLYGLMWNTPKLMKGLQARLTGKTNQTGLYMLKSGFQNVWIKIIKDEKLNVKTSVKIYSVYRTRLNNYEDVWIKMKVADGSTSWKHFDFLIWSPEMKTSLKFWHNREIHDERFYFSRVQPTFYTTALINSEGVQKGPSPIDYFLDNINKKRESSLWAQRDSYAAINGYNGDDYKNNKLESGNDTKATRTTITYQMSDREPFYLVLQYILKNSLKKLGATAIEVKQFKTWRYFPRYSPADMEKGYIWRILEMQGKHGMWYIGSSVCFESVKSVLEYNKILISNMKLPNQKYTKIVREKRHKKKHHKKYHKKYHKRYNKKVVYG